MGNKNSGTPKCEMIKLDGSMIHKDGKVTRSNFFKFLQLPIGVGGDIEMTPEPAIKYRNHIVRMKLGTSAAIPLLCSGPRCPTKQCPFHEEKNWPLTQQCPIEAQLIQMWTVDYVETLGAEPDDITVMILINQLVECDIIDYRANIGLSAGTDEEAGTLLKTTITDTGKSITETVAIHPLLEAKDKVRKWRKETLEALAATPREKWKKAAAMKQRDTHNDASEHMASLQDMVSKMEAEKQKVLDAKTLQEENDKIEDVDWEQLTDDI